MYFKRWYYIKFNGRRIVIILLYTRIIINIGVMYENTNAISINKFHKDVSNKFLIKLYLK